MPITSSELLVYKSQYMVDDSSLNGGIMTSNPSLSGLKNNIFPDVPDSERQTGSTKLRKVFWKVADAENGTLFDSKIYIRQFTNGEDYVTCFLGTQTDVEDDLTGTERHYGNGWMTNNVAAGATSFDITVESASIASEIFQNGDSIWIGDGVNEEFHENITVSVSGDQVTITLDNGTGDMVNNNYNSDSVVSSVLSVGNIHTSWDNWTETSTSGTYDETTHPPILDNIGCIEQEWTITFSNSTQFICSGNIVGNIGSGDISTDFSPDNPDFSGHPYFTLESAGWGGTWASGDTIVFSTHPSAIPIWFRRIVPAGCSSTTNQFIHALTGESA